jgi:hypothetical protein
VRPHRGDALAGPAVAVPGLEAVAIEKARDQVVAGDQHKLAHGFDDVGRCAVALPAPALRQAHLAVGAACPVHDQNDLRRGVVDIGDHFVDQDAHDPLPQPSVGGGR